MSKTKLVLREREEKKPTNISHLSQLRTKSASDLDLTKDYQTLGASATPPVRTEGRKSSYAGVIPNTFMSESCDNVSDLGVSSNVTW